MEKRNVINNRIFVNVFITENEEMRQGVGEKERQRERLKMRKKYFVLIVLKVKKEDYRR